MYKKLISLLLITLCVLSPIAWADDIPGPVIESDRSFTNTSGLYIQMQGAYNFGKKVSDDSLGLNALVHHDKPASGYQSATETYKTRGFAARLSAGYDLGALLSIEVGAFMNPSQKSTLTDLQPYAPAKGGTPADPPPPSTSPTQDKGIDKVSSWGVDAVAKIRLPFSDTFYGFAGGGAALTRYKYTNGDKQGNYLTDHKDIGDQNWHKVVPEFVIGIGVSVTDHLAVATQYTHAFGSYGLDEVVQEITEHKTPTVAMAQNILLMNLIYKF